MTHEVEGFILRGTHPLKQHGRLRSLVRAPLDQGFVLVPLTEALVEEIGGASGALATNPHPVFRSMSVALERLLCDLSADGPVAYVETEYWGGEGHQAAAVWTDGSSIFGPEKQDIGPINAALEHLGASAEGARDAFEAVGLHRHRLTDDWTGNG